MSLVAAALAGPARAQDRAPAGASGARAVPAARLAVYVEFDGLAAHAEAWHKTAAYRMFRETSAGAMVEAIAGQVLAGLPPGGGPVTNEEARALVGHVLEHGFTWGLRGPRAGDDKGPPLVVLVLPKAAKHETIGKLLARGGEGRKIERDGRTITVMHRPGQPQGTAYWAEGEDLVVGMGSGEADLDAVLAALKGDGSAVDHPVRKALRAPAGGVEPVALAFVDLAALPPMPEDARRAGLDGLNRIEARWGFAGEAIVSRARAVAPAPRRGVLALMDQPTFGADSLPPLAPGATSFALLSVDWTRVLDRVAALPDARRDVNRAEEQFARATGLDLRTEVLDVLGPRWAFYVQPSGAGGGGLGANPVAGMLLNPPRLTAAVQTRKPEAFARAADKLFATLNRRLRAEAKGDAPPVQVKPYEEGETKGFLLEVPPEVAPLPPAIRPALILGKEYAALSLTPDLARTGLDGAASDEVKKAVADAGDGLIAFLQSDPRGTVPELIANLPFLAQLAGRMGNEPGSPPWLKGLGAVRVDPKLIPRPDDLRKYLFPGTTAVRVTDDGLEIATRQSIPSLGVGATSPVAIALLLPAVQAAREAARRAQCVNNMKQIGLAMHNFASATDAFPAAAIRDKDGKPLLSWRVAILPYLEQGALYNEFKLDEPWDSPHNTALIERMPLIYKCPSRPMATGLTPYQVFTGGGALFDGEKGPRFQDITDGTSNTLMVAEAKAGVPWTKPDDITFDPADAALMAKLGGNHTGGFNALFGDGSVRFLKTSIDLGMLRKLVTRAGGEPIEFPNP
jgi:prepilin-type processing-associated H-X9-DG protein